MVDFQQVDVEAATVFRVCLVIVIAQAHTVVGVRDTSGTFTYPVRLETGNTLSTPREISSRKGRIRQDNPDFLGDLVQFVRDH